MRKQLLMCVEDVAGYFGESFATKGRTYVMVDSALCARCGASAVSVEGVAHPYTSACIPGPNWLPGRSFVPLNDPGTEPEGEEAKVPPARELARAE